MNIFGSIQILHHEIRIISLSLSIILFAYFFFKIKDTLLIRTLSASLFMFAGLLLCEIPWIFGLFLHKTNIVLGLDVAAFFLGEIIIIYAFDHLKRKGLVDIPYIDPSRWLIIISIVTVLTMILDLSGFYPQWLGYLDGGLSVDPHTVFPFNIEWSGAKAIGMLGWFWIVRDDKGV